MAHPPSRSVVEIDFLGLAPPQPAARMGEQYRDNQHHHHQKPGLDRRGGGGGSSSIRDIHKTVSRMDPDVLRSLIAAVPVARLPQKNTNSNSNAAPIQTLNPFTSRSPISSSPSETPAAPQPQHQLLAPLTIFYDGAVSVFDVPPQVADLIIKTATTGSSLAAAALSTERAMAETLVSDAPLSGLPLARKKSLRRFLEKRQQRLTSAAPYTTPSSAASSSTGAGDGEVVAAAASEGPRSDCNHWAMSDSPLQLPPKQLQLRLPDGRNSTTSSSSNSTAAAATHVTGAW